MATAPKASKAPKIIDDVATAEGGVIDFGKYLAEHKLTPQQAAAATKTFEAVKDKPPQMVKIALIHSDHEYQTPLIESIVEEIVNNFNILAVNPPLLSRRADGTLWVIDGQHTINAFIRLGRTEIECKIVTGLTVKDEAILFLIRNAPGSRRKLSKLQSFGARVKADDPIAVGMNKVFKTGRWSLHGRGSMKITSVPQAEECYLLDKGRSLSLALADVDNAWPNRKVPVTFTVVKAVAYMHYNGHRLGEKVDQRRLRLALGFNLSARKRNDQYPPLTAQDYVDRVRTTLEVDTVPNSRYMPRYIGEEILTIYNYRLEAADKLKAGDYLAGLPNPNDDTSKN